MIATTWGTDASERALTFPCDEYLDHANGAYYRGVTVRAPARIVFRWLCQMRVAPYSYDWIDNLGRTSPQTLTPGLEDLALGQRVMKLFELVAFEQDVHLTGRTVADARTTRLFGEHAATYMVRPDSARGCRLIVKYVVRYPRGPVGWMMRAVLPWGDLIMMRRQLLNFRRLAEAQDAAAAGQPADPW